MENYTRNREGARVVAGLILVAVGAAFLLRNLGFYLPSWLFTWPVLLIMIGIYSGVKHNFSNYSWIILIGIGGVFLAGKLLPEFHFDIAIWPVIIIGIGMLFILQPRGMSGNRRNLRREQFEQEVGLSGNTGTGFTAPADSSDFLYVDSVFSGVNKKMMSKNFQGGKIHCIFGGAEIDFMQADIQGTVVLNIELLFGGAKIIVPANWVIVNEINGLFHGVDDKRRNTMVIPDPAKTLVLKGSVNFGGVDIRG